MPNVAAAYIYGSWARRYFGEDISQPRDIDVAVIGDMDPNAVYAVARRAESELNIDVDPLVITPLEWAAPCGIVKRIKAGPMVPLEIGRAAA